LEELVPAISILHLQKLLMSRLAKERKLSVETKKKISESLKGELNPFYNKIHTAESIKKIIKNKSLSEIYIYNSYRELMVIFPSVTTFCKSIKANNTRLWRLLIKLLKVEIYLEVSGIFLRLPLALCLPILFYLL
jgi:hypothetical protein